MAAYFVVMGLFCVAALVLEQLYLAIGEAVVTLLLLAGYQWANLRRRRALHEYVQSTNEMMRRASDSEVPFPVALIQLNEDELVWYNKPFAERGSESVDKLNAPFGKFGAQLSRRRHSGLK